MIGWPTSPPSSTAPRAEGASAPSHLADLSRADAIEEPHRRHPRAREADERARHALERAVARLGG